MKIQLHIFFLLYSYTLFLKFDTNNALLPTVAPHPLLWQRIFKVLDLEAALEL